MLKGAGVALLGGAGLVASAGNAAALESNFSVQNNPSVSNDDGIVTFFTVTATGGFAFDGLDHAAKNATLELYAKAQDADEYGEPVDGYTADVNGTHGNYSFGQEADFDALSADLVDKFGSEFFSVAEDGTVDVETPVDLKLNVEVTYANTSVSDAPTTTMTLTTTNQPAASSAQAAAEGMAGGFHQSYQFDDGGHPNVEPQVYSASTVLGAPLTVDARYDDDVVVYRFDLPRAFEDGSQDNLGVVVDADDTDSFGSNTQHVFAHASNGLGAKSYDGGWSAKKDVSEVEADIYVTEDNSEVWVTVPTSAIGPDYSIGFRLAYAGSDFDQSDSYPDGTNFAVWHTAYADVFGDSSDQLEQSTDMGA